MTEKILLGIDEVGRGPWAGPLVVGAVVLGPDFRTLPEYDQLTDSKKLTTKKRAALNELILARAAATGLGWVSASEIDRYGLGPALKLAARRAVKPILARIATNLQTHPIKSQTHVTEPQPSKSQPTNASFPSTSIPFILTKFDEIIIDGTINLLADTPLADKVTLLPKADFLVKEVSAASIIAKVARDRYMVDLAEQYPGYGFKGHVGYGTAAHRAALLSLGPCPEHRKSFRPIADLLNAGQSSTAPQPHITPSPTSPDTTTARGQKAEQIVAEYLTTEYNHTIIARNFKTKSYEIDLISVTPQPHIASNTATAQQPHIAPSTTTQQPHKIYFTEVKYRKSAARGTPLASITPKKRQQIRFAAEAFLARHPEFQAYQPVLAAASVSGSDFHLDDWFILTE